MENGLSGEPIHPEETEDHFEHFAPDADGILDWVRTTSPRPSRADALEHIQWLRARGLLPDEETAKLAGVYPELLGHGNPEEAEAEA